MGRVCARILMAAGLLFTAAAALAQDVTWQRLVQGRLDGVQLAMYHGGADYTKPAFVDIDNDGDGDLYVGEHDGYLNYLENLGGNPAQWAGITSGLDSIDVGKQCAPAFWDCDLDGDKDMFLGNEDGRVWFFRNTGTPANPDFTLEDTAYQNIDVGYHAVPAFGDLDGDSLSDLLIGANSGFFCYYRNIGTPGNPVFTQQSTHYENINMQMKSTVYITDANNDGLSDLFVSGLQAEIYYYRNNGQTEPHFTNMGVAAEVDHNGAPTLWDLNGDGKLDLVSGRSDGNLTVWMNTGSLQNPRWQYSQDQLGYFDNGYYSKPALGDLNGDSLVDMLVARGLPGIHYFQNVGTADSAAWQQVSEYYAGINLSNGEAPCLNDIENDGDLDLVVGCGNGTLTYYQNTGTPQNAQWAPGVSNYANVNVTGWSAPTFADIDGDGDKDMFVGSVSGTLRYIRRDGPPTNPVWADLGNVPGINVGSHSAPAFADLDGDGDLDLYVGNGSNAGNLYFYRNTGSQYWPAWTVVTPVYQFWDFGDMSAPVFADLNNDNRKDLIIGCNSGGLYHFLNISSIHAVNVYMTPLGAPIIIPRNGGWFNFNITIINHENIPVTYQAWIMVGLPNGAWYGPVFGPFTQTLQPGVNFSRYRTQEVPGSAPPGVYTYRSFVGNYPAKWDSASFNFTKQAAGDGGQIWEGWACEEMGSSQLSALSSQPSAFSLGEATPNPFNPATAISYKLQASSHVSLKVYNISGGLVGTLVDGVEEAGSHQVTFDGSGLSTGLYFVKMQAGDYSAVKKMMLVK